jgi:signal transduction histidine kinase
MEARTELDASRAASRGAKLVVDGGSHRRRIAAGFWGAVVLAVVLAVFALLMASRVLAVAATLVGGMLFVALGMRITRSIRALDEHIAAAARQVSEVEARNRELDAFAGRVAHDLHNFLYPIALAAALMQVELDRPDRVGLLARRIQRGMERSSALIDGLLAFARSGRPDPDAACSISAVVKESLEQLLPVAQRIGATLQTRVDDADVACSRELLDVVVLNLAGNALKFMEGREQRRLSIAARAVDGACELAVADTGPGIPDAELGRIFEPFHRVPGTQIPGSGLGLATVARIVGAHGGRIAVKSALGEGTTFTVSLPLASSHTSPQLPS